MIAVIFELSPREAEREHYFELTASLREELLGMDGFISVERFQSLTTENKYLSLSFWRDEAAVKAWRASANHRSAQSEGRTSVFANYRLRVAHVVRDYGLNERDEAPEDSRSAHL